MFFRKGAFSSRYKAQKLEKETVVCKLYKRNDDFDTNYIMQTNGIPSTNYYNDHEKGTKTNPINSLNHDEQNDFTPRDYEIVEAPQEATIPVPTTKNPPKSILKKTSFAKPSEPDAEKLNLAMISVKDYDGPSVEFMEKKMNVAKDPSRTDRRDTKAIIAPQKARTKEEKERMKKAMREEKDNVKKAGMVNTEKNNRESEGKDEKQKLNKEKNNRESEDKNEKKNEENNDISYQTRMSMMYSSQASSIFFSQEEEQVNVGISNSEDADGRNEFMSTSASISKETEKDARDFLKERHLRRSNEETGEQNSNEEENKTKHDRDLNAMDSINKLPDKVDEMKDDRKYSSDDYQIIYVKPGDEMESITEKAVTKILDADDQTIYYEIVKSDKITDDAGNYEIVIPKPQNELNTKIGHNSEIIKDKESNQEPTDYEIVIPKPKEEIDTRSENNKVKDTDGEASEYEIVNPKPEKETDTKNDDKVVIPKVIPEKVKIMVQDNESDDDFEPEYFKEPDAMPIVESTKKNKMADVKNKKNKGVANVNVHDYDDVGQTSV